MVILCINCGSRKGNNWYIPRNYYELVHINSLLQSLSHSVDLTVCALDFFTAGSTLRSLKPLKLTAPFIIASNHQSPAAVIAPMTAYEGHNVTDRAGGCKRPPAPWAYCVAPYYGPVTCGAIVPERRTAAALGAMPGIPVYHIVTMEAGLFICCHINVHVLSKHLSQAYQILYHL